MAKITLKSYEFRREREGTWRELEELVRRAEKRGLKVLSAAELLRLPHLYRATMSSLSVARAISLDQNLLSYLESLCARGYFIVYGANAGFLDGLKRFLAEGFPGAVRHVRYHVLAAALLMAVGIFAAHMLVSSDSDWFYTIVGESMAQGRTPTATTEELREVLFDDDKPAAQMLQLFATFLFTHNASVGMFSFALGFALGLPTALLMLYNGLIIGALSALYASRDLSVELWGWLSIHGTTELLAIALCGGAGLHIASGILFPGVHGRLETLARNGRRAGVIVIGSVLMFFVAGLLEGFGRQLVTDTAARYTIGGAALLCWMLYFWRAGRVRDHG